MPDSVGSGLKPDTREPATTATVPVRTIAAIAYVAVASTFAAKTCPRSTERVRIVFSVPLWSSAATMSPATSAVMSGNIQIEPNSSRTNGIARPVSWM